MTSGKLKNAEFCGSAEVWHAYCSKFTSDRRQPLFGHIHIDSKTQEIPFYRHTYSTTEAIHVLQRD